MSRHTDTISALATPVGTSAIAVVRVSGPDTERLVREIFGGTPPPRTARHADYRDRSGRLVDDVLYTYFPGPHSYTGEAVLEVSCHGNPFVAQAILEDLLARECRAAAPGEFTQRAFLNGRIDLTQAEAVMDLIQARSERALTAANLQLRGALGRRMNQLIERLLGVLARIEAYIDFPEEDLPPEDRRFLAEEIDRLVDESAKLLATSHYGSILRNGIRTVIVGATNAGKSSLLNRLVGYDRALVSAEPGTTRDFIEEGAMLGSHWFRLIDTAGLNASPAPVEKLGIAKTMECVESADILLMVNDASRPNPTSPVELASVLKAKPHLVVLNKLDIADRKTLADFSGSAVAVSTVTGEGMEKLVAGLVELAESFRSELGEEVVAVSARHADALGRARSSLGEARTKISVEAPVELLASDLREALDALGEIAGRVDNERMLDQLFATFCIGK